MRSESPRVMLSEPSRRRETSTSVASITVGYNGGDALARNIEALLGQKRALQEIIVVDNASTDGTSSRLGERYPQATVLRMPQNLGPGGALAAGLAYAALQKKHDWIWMFDQDSVPAPSTLEIMLEEAERVDDRVDDNDHEIGILAALPVSHDMETSSSPWLWRDGFVKPPAELFNQAVLFSDLVITSGSMVRREVVERIGLPRTDFFIDFVDYEYCLRARSHGYKIAVITRAKLHHEIGKAHQFHFMGRRRLWSEHRPFREYYMSRNLAYSVWWLYPSWRAKGFVLWHLLRHAIGVLLFGTEKLACWKRMAQGFYDGRRASLGVRFQPD
jgi:GT2 family glycosyltransferase